MLNAKVALTTKPLPAGAGTPAALRFSVKQAGTVIGTPIDTQGAEASFPTPPDGLYEVFAQRLDSTGTLFGDESTSGEFMLSGGQVVPTYQAPGAVAISITPDAAAAPVDTSAAPAA